MFLVGVCRVWLVGDCLLLVVRLLLVVVLGVVGGGEYGSCTFNSQEPLKNKKERGAQLPKFPDLTHLLLDLSGQIYWNTQNIYMQALTPRYIDMSKKKQYIMNP